jgi:hypothetical protein
VNSRWVTQLKAKNKILPAEKCSISRLQPRMSFRWRKAVWCWDIHEVK